VRGRLSESERERESARTQHIFSEYDYFLCVCIYNVSERECVSERVCFCVCFCVFVFVFVFVFVCVHTVSMYLFFCVYLCVLCVRERVSERRPVSERVCDCV
jgi:hypothetical protein